MENARHWRTQRARAALLGKLCEPCRKIVFPPRDRCPACARPLCQDRALSGRGEVYSFSTVFHAPQGFVEQAPYVVALVRLEEGPFVAAQLADLDPDDVRIGMFVSLVVRRLRQDGPEGIVLHGYKFRPVLAGGAE